MRVLYTSEDFMNLMSVDKKNVDGRLRLVLLKAIGDAFITENASADNIRDTLKAFLPQAG